MLYTVRLVSYKYCVCVCVPINKQHNVYAKGHTHRCKRSMTKIENSWYDLVPNRKYECVQCSLRLLLIFCLLVCFINRSLNRCDCCCVLFSYNNWSDDCPSLLHHLSLGLVQSTVYIYFQKQTRLMFYHLSVAFKKENRPLSEVDRYQRCRNQMCVFFLSLFLCVARRLL